MHRLPLLPDTLRLGMLRTRRPVVRSLTRLPRTLPLSSLMLSQVEAGVHLTPSDALSLLQGCCAPMMPSFRPSPLPDIVSGRGYCTHDCSSSPVSAHPLATPCLHSHSGASQLISLGSGAREPDERFVLFKFPIHSLSRPSPPSRPPPFAGLAGRAMSKEAYQSVILWRSCLSADECTRTELY